MTNKTGYVDSIPFIHKWAAACKPYEIDINLQYHGLASRLAEPDIRVVDLGCGSGATLLLLAESMPNSEFVGLDFNPEHIDWANEFARKSNLKNITFKQESFASTLQSTYGTFDLVICQGVYSWVSDAVRQEALDCIDRLAATEAALQISWNTEAGFAQVVPLRSILREMINVEEREHEEDWAKVFSLFQTLESMEVPWLRKNPVGRDRIEGWKTSNPRYLAHEYLNEAWHLTNFNDISRALLQYGFEFGGYSFFERWRLNNPDIEFDDTHAGMEEQIAELALSVPHRNDTFVRGKPSTTPPVLETACFACPQPADLVSVQLIAHQSKKTTGILHQCLKGPKTVAELLQLSSDQEPAQVIARIRDELSRGMIIRVDDEVVDIEGVDDDASPVDISTQMEFATAFSKNLIDDTKLLTELSHFPSRITRGGIQVPATIALLVDEFCKTDNEDQWYLQSQQRIAASGIALEEAELRKTMQSCTKSWIPFLLFHQVLQK